MIFLLAAFSTAKLGDLIGISSAPSPAGTRAITAVTVDPATGVPSKLVGLNASWGYFTDSSATADHANSLYYVMLAPSVATSVLVKIDVTKGAVVDQKEYDMPFGLLTYDYEKAELYASESNGFDGDCVYRIDPATLEATELARRLGGLREWACRRPGGGGGLLDGGEHGERVDRPLDRLRHRPAGKIVTEARTSTASRSPRSSSPSTTTPIASRHRRHVLRRPRLASTPGCKGTLVLARPDGADREGETARQPAHLRRARAPTRASTASARARITARAQSEAAAAAGRP